MFLNYSLAIFIAILTAIMFSSCLLFVVPVSDADAILISALPVILVCVPTCLYFSTLTIKQNASIFILLTLTVFLIFNL